MELYVKLTDTEYEEYRKYIVEKQNFKEDYVKKSELTLHKAMELLGYKRTVIKNIMDPLGRDIIVYENEDEDYQIKVYKK